MKGDRNKKKVLLISHEMTYTGAPRSLFFLHDILQEMGYVVLVWSLKAGPFLEKYTKAKCEVKVIGFPECISDKLAEEISTYDLVIANTVFGAAFARYASQYTKTILWLREAENISEIIHNCALNALDILYSKDIICVSEYARSAIQSFCPLSNIHVIHNYIPDRGRISFNLVIKQKIKFIVSGTIEVRKQQHIAIEAYQMMPLELKEICELHIVGDRAEWSAAYWKPLIKNIPEGIIWHERIDNDNELYTLYNQMNVFIVPSLDESCSLVALEAAMLGKALLISDKVGAKYLIADDDYIFKHGDVQELSRKMCYLTSRKKLLSQGLKMRQAYLREGTKKQYKKALRRTLKNFAKI